MSKLKVLVVLFVVLGFFGTAFSQNFPGDRAGRKADHLYKKLSLTNEQYVKVYQSLLNYEMKVDDLKAKKMDKNGLASEMTKLQGASNMDIEKIFTKDQSTKWVPLKDKFYKLTWKKKVRKPKTDTMNTEKKDETKKDDMKKDTKKDDMKKDTKKDDMKKDTKKEEKRK